MNETPHLLLLPTLTLAMGLATVPALAQHTPNAPAEEPFATLAAKGAQPPTVAGTSVVVQRADGSAASDAIVVFAPTRDEAAREAWRLAERRSATIFPTDLPRRLALQHAASTRYAVDEHGATRLPKDGHVLAFVGEQLAWRTLAASLNEPRATLYLAAPRAVTVEVTTATGAAAAGVPVLLSRPADPEPQPLARTTAEGRLDLRLLPEAIGGTRLWLDVVARTRLDATLPANGDRVCMQLPVTTCVTAAFEGDLAPATELSFGLQGAAGAARTIGERIDARRARWPFVEVGIAAKATVWSEQLAIAQEQVEIRTADPTLVLTRANEPATLAVPILDVDGARAADRLVSVVWSEGDLVGTPIRTNREGWLELHVPPHLLGRDTTGLRVNLLRGAAAERPLATGELQVTPLPNRWTQLPPLRCQPLPKLAGGTLVTPDGEPVPAFDLHVYHHGWQVVRTDAAGQFAVHSANSGDDAMLALPHTWSFVFGDPWKARLRSDSFDQQYAVHRSSRVRFSFTAPGPIDSVLHWRLQPADGSTGGVSVPFSPADRELLVPPGTWHFVLFGDTREALHRVEDVHCPSGVEVHDARFLQFDWRTVAVLVELSLRDADGQPTDACAVWVRTTGSRRLPNATGGTLRLLLPPGGADLEFVPHDERLPKFLRRQVTTDQRIVVGEGPPLSVTLQPMPQLLPGLELRLAADDGKGVPFGDDDTATLVTTAGVPCEPRLYVYGPNSRLGPLPWPLPCVEVPAGGQAIVVQVSMEQQLELSTLMWQAWRR